MKCETCIPGIDGDFRLTRLNEFGLLEEVHNKALCPEEARLSACDVADCADELVRRRINLNDKEAVEAAALQTEWVGDAIDDGRLESGQLDVFIERVIRCARHLRGDPPLGGFRQRH
jgi:hypothetical protein